MSSGRPNVCGYFRSFEQRAADDGPHRSRGYHKPIMIAGGLGNIRRQHVHKGEVSRWGRSWVVLGGPAMLIGLGGGAALLHDRVAAAAPDLDFASVQRGNSGDRAARARK